MKEALFIFISAVIPCFFTIETCVPTSLDMYLNKYDYNRDMPLDITLFYIPCEEMDVYYRWKVTDGDGTVILTSKNSSIRILGRELPFPKVYETKYYVEVNISHNSDMSYSAYRKEEFMYAAQSMKLRIVGGPERKYPPTKDLLLDGLSLSQDYSFAHSERGFLDNDVSWDIDPPLPGINTKRYVFTVPKERLILGTVYNFTMTVVRVEIAKKREIKSISQIVTIADVKLPKIKIMCRRNCEYFNPKDDTAFSVTCLKDCEIFSKEAIWILSPFVDKMYLDFGSGYDKVVIPANIYDPNENLRVVVESGGVLADYNLTFFPDIVRGDCSILPEEGISGITLFKVSCSRFKSAAGITKYAIFQTFSNYEKGVLLTEDKVLNKKEVFLSEGSPVTLIIVVQDNAFMEAETELTVEVKTSTVNLIDLKNLVNGDNSYSMFRLVQKRARNELSQSVSFVLDAIETLPDVPVIEKKFLYQNMAKYLYILEPFDISTVIQIISVAKKIEKMKVPTDTLTTRFLGKCTLNAVKVLQYISVYNLESIPPSSFFNSFLERIVRLVSSFLREVPDLQGNLNLELNPVDYDTYDEMVSDRLQIRDNMRDVTESALTTLQLLGACTLRQSFPDEKSIEFFSQSVVCQVRKILTKSLTDLLQFYFHSTASIYFSDPLKVELESVGDFFEYQFCDFKINPFWWHKNESKHMTDRITFDIFQDGMKFNNVIEPLSIALFPKETVPVAYLNGTVTTRHNYENIAVHRILLQSHSQIIVEFDAPTPYLATVADCHCGKEQFHEYSKYISDEYPEDTRMFRIDPKENRNIFYICVMRLSDEDLYYSARISEYNCAFYDMVVGDFNLESCKATRLSTDMFTPFYCECTHLSFYSGVFFVAPNYINVPDTVAFRIILAENWTMVLIIFSLLIIWALLLFWAFIKDKELNKKNFICKLDDNVPGDKHVYLIVIFTGVYLDAGTTADVGFQIIGEQSESRVHLIKCCKTLLLQRNSEDWFIIYTPEFLGDLKKLRLWHNCKGKDPHWYCQRVIVQHLESGTQYCFLVNEWLSLVWGQGKIYLEILVNEETHLKSTKVLFAVKLEKFKEEHLWLSVFTRAPQSNFNSKERVSSAMTVIFMSMLASAMFFGIPKNQPSDSIDSQSTYFINMETITIFLESWLVAVPIGILIVFIFKHSAPHS